MAELDYKKLNSDERVGVFGGPSGSATGIQDLKEPQADEINNTGGVSGVIPFSQSLSWSDTEIPGVRDSDSTNEPSLADPATREEFGPTNYDGSLSMFLPSEYDDLSNDHALVYELTKDMREILDFAVRIDGDIDALAAAADGQYVSTSRQQILSETNPFDFSASVRRTVGTKGKGGFAHYTIVGDHTLTIVPPPGGFSAGDKGRILVTVQGRDYTNAVSFQSDDPSVINVYPGGFFEVTGDATDEATITVSERGVTSETLQVTVS